VLWHESLARSQHPRGCPIGDNHQDFWIVDLVKKVVHIHRLKEGLYQVTTQRHGKISPEHFPDVTVDLDELF
jgi:Uma2 family endonuclease